MTPTKEAIAVRNEAATDADTKANAFLVLLIRGVGAQIRRRHRVLMLRPGTIRAWTWLPHKLRVQLDERFVHSPWWLGTRHHDSVEALMKFRAAATVTRIVNLLKAKRITVEQLEAFLKRTPLSPVLKQRVMDAIAVHNGETIPQPTLMELLRYIPWGFGRRNQMWGSPAASQVIVDAAASGEIAQLIAANKVDPRVVAKLREWNFIGTDNMSPVPMLPTSRRVPVAREPDDVPRDGLFDTGVLHAVVDTWAQDAQVGADN